MVKHASIGACIPTRKGDIGEFKRSPFSRYGLRRQPELHPPPRSFPFFRLGARAFECRFRLSPLQTLPSLKPLFAHLRPGAPPRPEARECVRHLLWPAQARRLWDRLRPRREHGARQDVRRIAVLSLARDYTGVALFVQIGRLVAGRPPLPDRLEPIPFRRGESRAARAEDHSGILPSTLAKVLAPSTPSARAHAPGPESRKHHTRHPHPHATLTLPSPARCPNAALTLTLRLP